MIGVGVIGHGYWGPNLVRNLMGAGDFVVRGICEQDRARHRSAHASCPTAEITTDARDLIADPTINAVAIATPVATHYELAAAALEAGKHVLVEKPLTASPESARRLVDRALAARKVLMVDHTFVYSGAVRKMGELVREGRLGEILYYDSTRANFGIFRRDVNVLWDLAVHDVAIADQLFPRPPVEACAVGVRHVPGYPESTAYVTLRYDGPLIAHLDVSWLAPFKIRRTMVAGTRQMLVYDDLEADEKIKLYDKGVEREGAAGGEGAIAYRAGDVRSPRLDHTEALSAVARHFADCIEHDRRPITDGEAGLRVVEIVAAAHRSMAAGGRPVAIGAPA